MLAGPFTVDIIFDVMGAVELEPEVAQWMNGLSVAEFASVLPYVERLAERGSLLRMPATRSLGDGLFELRFNLLRVAWRSTYFFGPDRRIVLLTVFRKQRQNERTEVQRARRAMYRCVTEGHSVEEDD